MTAPETVTLSDIEEARDRIAERVLRTPVVPAFDVSAETGGDVWLKLEILQATGAFKLRGATNALLSLSEDERAAGVVASSTGNHGRAVAYAAKQLGIRAVICMSDLVPRVKVDGIKRLGAEARIIGKSQDEADVEAARLVREEGMTYVSPYDDHAVIAGQGTIGLELLEDLPDLDIAVVPLSGGGLIAGIARALKSLKPSVNVVGVTMDRGAAMHESIKAGHPVEVEEYESLADSLGGGIGLNNRYSFALCRDLLDETLLVTEREIAEAMRTLFLTQQLAVEGGAAVGVAALMTGKLDVKGKKVALVISGRNVDMDTFQKVVADPESVAQ